jgi:hypothetical protein
MSPLPLLNKPPVNQELLKAIVERVGALDFSGWKRTTVYEKGVVTTIAVTRPSIPSPIIRNDDGSIFVPLECSVEEGEARMSSLTGKK